MWTSKSMARTRFTAKAMWRPWRVKIEEIRVPEDQENESR